MRRSVHSVDTITGRRQGGNSSAYSVAHHHRIFRTHSSQSGVFRRSRRVSEYGFRDYEPEWGRWASRDPIGEEWGGNNVYAYILNEVFVYVDPLGLSAEHILNLPLRYHTDFLDFWNEAGLTSNIDRNTYGFTKGSLALPSAVCEFCQIKVPSEDKPGKTRVANCYKLVMQNGMVVKAESAVLLNPEPRKGERRGLKETDIDIITKFEQRWQGYYKGWFDANKDLITQALSKECTWKKPASCQNYKACVLNAGNLRDRSSILAKGLSAWYFVVNSEGVVAVWVWSSVLTIGLEKAFLQNELLFSVGQVGYRL